MKPVIRGKVKAVFGEGPLWDPDRQCLHWVDVAEKKILSYYPDTEENKSYAMPQVVSAMVKYSRDELLILMGGNVYLFHLEHESLQLFRSLDELGLSDRLLTNDGKCDPNGRFWFGSVDDGFRVHSENDATFDQEYSERIASLYRLDSDLNLTTVISGLAISNGMDWDRERNIMYYIDSVTRGIMQFQYDPETGQISDRQMVYQFEMMNGFPDGMTIDREGMLWVALFKSGQVARRTPSHGIVAKIDPIRKKWTDSIIVPVSHVTSCAFGGKDMSTLFITTGIVPHSNETQPGAGGLFSVDLPVGGYPPVTFKNRRK